MGGGGHVGPRLPHPLDDGDGQGRALHRVGACPQLVEEHQAVCIGLRQNGHDIGHMCRESRQILLNALLVPDVRQHAAVDGHGAPVPGGDLQPALGHEAEEPQRLQRHRLAAGIGAGDDQGVKGLPQLDVDGHGPGRVQQGMPRPPQVHAAVLPDLRPDALHPVGELGPGEDAVQQHQSVIVPADVVLVGGGVGGELGQDPLDLLLLLALQLDELVVGLHHPHGLHEDRGPGGGDVVDEAGHVRLALRLHRHHEAPVPLGDEALLQNFTIAGGGNNFLQDLPALGLGLPHVPPDVRQLRGRRVRDGVLVQDGALDLLLQEAVAVEGVEEVVDGALLPGLVVEVVPGPPGGGQKPRHRQKLDGAEAPAPVRPVQDLPDGLHPGKARAPPQGHHPPGGLGLLLQPLHVLDVRLRPQGQAAALGLVADSLGAEHFQHPGQLQRPQRFLK